MMQVDRDEVHLVVIAGQNVVLQVAGNDIQRMRQAKIAGLDICDRLQRVQLLAGRELHPGVLIQPGDHVDIFLERDLFVIERIVGRRGWGEKRDPEHGARAKRQQQDGQAARGDGSDAECRMGQPPPEDNGLAGAGPDVGSEHQNGVNDRKAHGRYDEDPNQYGRRFPVHDQRVDLIGKHEVHKQAEIVAPPFPCHRKPEQDGSCERARQNEPGAVIRQPFDVLKQRFGKPQPGDQSPQDVIERVFTLEARVFVGHLIAPPLHAAHSLFVLCPAYITTMGSRQMETLRQRRRAARMFWWIAAAQQQKSQACSADGAASLTFLADRVGFEPTSRLRDYLISSVVRLWQIHVWSRIFRAAL